MRTVPTILSVAAIVTTSLSVSGAEPHSALPDHRELASVKARAMAADYQADLEELARVRELARALARETESAYLAHYWAGFAAWRQAINGANLGMDPEKLKAHLRTALTDFEASIASKSDFADAHAGAAGVVYWLAGFEWAADPAKAMELTSIRDRRLGRAVELEPDNPRVLWITAAVQLFTPPEYGGDPGRAVTIYRRMIETAANQSPSPTLPDWGLPEAWMSLAFAHLNQPEPDLDTALAEARAALELRPDWAYVRDTLLPQIEAARK